MSLGLPAHLAPQALRRSLVAAQRTVSITLLCVALFAALVLQSARVDSMLWPAALVLLAPIGILLLLEHDRSGWWLAGYLLIGGFAIYVHALLLVGQPIPIVDSDGFSFLAVKVALIMVGGAALGVGPGLAWSTAGYVVAEAAIGVALLQAGLPLHLDAPAFFAYLATMVVIPLVGYVHRRQLGAQPRLHRAAQDEQVAALRYRIEVKAATLMHDTVLNNLAALADSSGDRLDPTLRRQIQEDVDSLVGEEWLADSSDAVEEKIRLDWQHSGLFTAIQESRLLGLEVDTTGDLAAVGRLDRESSIALGLAVKQCLVNVLKHSGTTYAEVAVYGSDTALSVMVVDNGAGFSEAATGADRLGLRSSVRKRIELLGGQVNVWSTPGRGTSIMIKVPVAGHEGATTAPSQVATGPVATGPVTLGGDTP
ncbi:MAG TPA: ATP-binding protein [Terrimesophilobacter sp.]|nr:ATP-binding protein [Terrimesophilobacter sp.]